MKIEMLIDRKTGQPYWLATFNMQGVTGMTEGESRMEAFNSAVYVMRKRLNKRIGTDA